MFPETKSMETSGLEGGVLTSSTVRTEFSFLGGGGASLILIRGRNS